MRHALALFSLALAAALAANGQNIATFAGGGPNNVAPLSANLASPSAVAVDPHDSSIYYIAVGSQHRVFKVAGGQLTAFAGNGGPGSSPDGTPAAEAALSNPVDVAVAPATAGGITAGDVFIADSGNKVLYKVSASDGTISTVASGSPLVSPGGVAVDPSGNVYIADPSPGVVYKLTSGTLSPLVSTGLVSPGGLAVDPAGAILYIANSGLQVVDQVATTGGALTVFAGTPTVFGFTGDGGSPTSADLWNPTRVAVDSTGNVFIADTLNNRIRAVTNCATSCVINTVAGSGAGVFSGDGGQATLAVLNTPAGVAVDGSGSVFIADTGNFRIREVSGGIINTVAGNGEGVFSGDGGLATAATLNAPVAVAVDPTTGNLAIADQNNVAIRLVTPAGAISTVLGGPHSVGMPSGFFLSTPAGVAFDSSGNLFVSDSDSWSGDVVYKLAAGSTVASDFADYWTISGLSTPSGLATDGPGNLYIADPGSAAVYKVTADGTTTSTLIASGLNAPIGLAFNATHTLLYVADMGADTVFKFDGVNLTPFVSSGLNAPTGVRVDAAGNVYVADMGNNVVKEFDSTGALVGSGPVAGNGSFGFSGDGGLATAAELAFPADVAIDATGNFFIADESNNRVRKVTNTVSCAPTTLTGQSATVPFGAASATLGGTISAGATGMVSITVGGTTVAATISTGTFSASFPTSSLAVATYPISYSYAGNGASCSASDDSQTLSVTGQPSTATDLKVSLGSQQYSDKVTLTATVTVVAGTGTPRGTVNFYDDRNSIGSAILNGQNPNIASFVVSNLSLGAHNSLTAQYAGDTTFTGSISPAQTVTITQEDAVAVYTGALSASTMGINNNTTIVTLSATVQEKTDDPTFGDITKATVTFLEVTNPGSPVILGTVPVGIVNTADRSIGTATFNWQPTNPGTYKIRAVVGGYYIGVAPDVTVTVVQPGNDFVSGTGSLQLVNPAGQAAGAANSTASFDFNAKFTGGGNKILQGAFSLTYQGANSYQITGNSFNSLGETGNGSTATLDGPVTVRDVTHNMTLDANATVQVDMTGSTIGFTVWGSNGGVWFSSNWNGATTVQQAPNVGSRLFTH